MMKSLLIGAAAMFTALSMNAENQRETYLLDKGWKFHYGDIALPKLTSHHNVYKTVKAGNTRGVTGFNYDTSSWETVDLPHDAILNGDIDESALLSSGFLPRKISWYRRNFRLEESDRDKTVWLYFDGIGGISTIYVNGQEMEHLSNGYIGRRVNISDIAHYGDKPNVISVKSDAREPQGWWYEGGGVYRHVWLYKTHKLHVDQFGVYVNPQKVDDDEWETNVETTIESEINEDATVEITSTIIDAAGEEIESETDELFIKARKKAILKQVIDIDEPALWDIDSPSLYTIKTVVKKGGEIIDTHSQRYGYRTIEFTADKGIFLNGRYIKMQGVCQHQDHAGIGVAITDEIRKFRIARLKEMGVNAYRCSHNPPGPEVLKYCDELGMLVMNENRFFNSATEYLEQLREQVLRDRNNPSNIMWSLFNEEGWQGDERGRKIVERMSYLVKEYDTSRPVTGAQSGGYNKVGAFATADILGMNYSLNKHELARELFPDKHVYGSENVSHFSTRGEFETDRENNIFNNYDQHHAAWGSTLRHAWKYVNEREWDGGLYIWTGFDYRGEPTPRRWPVISSYFGILDTCGFPKDSFYLCQAYWTKKPMAHVFPHWTHDDSYIGKEIRVRVYTNGDEAELFLNGRSLGRHKVDKYDQLELKVKYEPGKLEAKTYKDGKPHAYSFVETTTKPVSLGVEAKFGEWERKEVYAGNRDSLPIAVFAADAKGRRCPKASNMVTFKVKSGGRILGVGNGDPQCHERDRASKRSLFNGYCSAILEVNKNARELVVEVTSPGLKPATLRLPVKRVKPEFAQYPVFGEGITLSEWRMAAITKERRDPNEKIALNDMNTWEDVAVGEGPQPQFANALGYTVYRTAFIMPKDQNAWELKFNELVGRAELYVNEKKVAEKKSFDAGTLATVLKLEGGKEVVVSLLVEAKSKDSGITKSVKMKRLRMKRVAPKAPKVKKDQLLVKAAAENTKEKAKTFKVTGDKKVRYVVLKVLSSHKNKAFAHASELLFVTASGKVPGKNIKVVYVSSDEHDSKASALFDGKTNTFWHSKWRGGEDEMPHYIVVDLGKAVVLTEVELKGREKYDFGGIKKFEIYGSEKVFKIGR